MKTRETSKMVDIIPDRLERTLFSRPVTIFMISFLPIMVVIGLTAVFATPEHLNALTGPLGAACTLAASAILGGHYRDAKVSTEMIKSESTRPPDRTNVSIEAQNVQVGKESEGG